MLLAGTAQQAAEPPVAAPRRLLPDEAMCVGLRTRVHDAYRCPSPRSVAPAKVCLYHSYKPGGVQARREAPHSFRSLGLNADRLLEPDA